MAVVTLDDQRKGLQVPGVPCDECGNLADIQVSGWGSDRYWECKHCGTVSREGLNMIGEPIYPGAADVEQDNDEFKNQTDITEYQSEDDGNGEDVLDNEDDDGDGYTCTTLDRWL